MGTVFFSVLSRNALCRFYSPWRAGRCVAWGGRPLRCRPHERYRLVLIMHDGFIGEFDIVRVGTRAPGVASSSADLQSSWMWCSCCKYNSTACRLRLHRSTAPARSAGRQTRWDPAEVCGGSSRSPRHEAVPAYPPSTCSLHVSQSRIRHTIPPTSHEFPTRPARWCWGASPQKRLVPEPTPTRKSARTPPRNTVACRV